MTLYPGERVRVVSWSPNFNGMRGKLLAIERGSRLLVQLDGDRGPTLFFVGEIVSDATEPHITAGG